MRSETIAILDYGVGNLYSVEQALQFVGVKNVIITRDINKIKSSDKLILPGVGAFGSGIKSLQSAGLIESIGHHVASGKSLLGICLGMQFLATQSEEMGMHSGLNLIPGSVRPIKSKLQKSGSNLRVPFIGWANIVEKSQSSNHKTILENALNRSLYFVHSYQFVPNNDEDIIASYNYGDQTITAAVQRENVIGLQFHPEKSGLIGLEVLRSFACELKT